MNNKAEWIDPKLENPEKEGLYFVIAEFRNISFEPYRTKSITYYNGILGWSSKVVVWLKNVPEYEDE